MAEPRVWDAAATVGQQEVAAGGEIAALCDDRPEPSAEALPHGLKRAAPGLRGVFRRAQDDRGAQVSGAEADAKAKSAEEAAERKLRRRLEPRRKQT